MVTQQRVRNTWVESRDNIQNGDSKQRAGAEVLPQDAEIKNIKGLRQPI